MDGKWLNWHVMTNDGETAFFWCAGRMISMSKWTVTVRVEARERWTKTVTKLSGKHPVMLMH